MNLVSLLFSGSGRLAQKPFAVAIVLVYVATFFSQMLLSAPVTARSGLWPFAIAQAAITWIWIVLHKKRLRDAGRSHGAAIGIACLYVLAVVLLLLVMIMITASDSSSEPARAGQGIIRIFLVLYLFGLLVGSNEFGVLAYWLMGFAALLLMPLLISLGYSVWAATRPSTPPAAPAATPQP